MSKLIEFSPKQKKIIKAPFNVTLEALEGTPRSGKTTAGHFRHAYYLTNTRDTNHLIAAYNQEQAYRLFIDGDGTGLAHIFGDLSKIKHDDHGDHLEVHTPKGVRRIYFKGGSKANSVGAILGMSLGSVVYCEINMLHMSFIQEGFRRTFAAKDRYHLADLNPPAPNHPVIDQVFDVQNTRWTHWTIHDNPILTEERKQEIYGTLKKSKYLLDRDWYGKRVMPEGVIYSMFDMDKNTSSTLLGKPYEMFFEADGGQSDATSCACFIVTRYNETFRLNRVAHYYHSGKETGHVKAMSTYAKEIQAFVKYCTDKYQMRYTEFFVDPSCRSLREELRLLKIGTRPANNNAHDIKGSVKGIEVGIERMQNLMTNEQFFLVDDDKYDHYNFIREIGMYVRDEHSKPVDDWNHAQDENRYGGNYFYKRYVI